uniref:Uncharacterized protein n=1 Tax=Planktothricoides sp. SpSt-374 TaxID=2282167 RepID=A0A7C3VK88_9CYAN
MPSKLMRHPQPKVATSGLPHTPSGQNSFSLAPRPSPDDTARGSTVILTVGFYDGGMMLSAR